MRRKMFALILLAALLLSLGTACGKGTNVEKKLEGSWYKNGHTSLNRDMRDGPEYIFYSDGTCQIASEYGTCTWTIVNDGQLKLTNFYGEITTAEIGALTDEKLTLYFGQIPVYCYRTCSEQEISAEVTADGYTPVEVEYLSKFFRIGTLAVQYTDISGNKALGVMNTAGKIMPLTSFPNIYFAFPVGAGKIGVYFSDGSYIQFALVDTSGNIIYRSPADADYSVALSDNGLLGIEKYMMGDEKCFGILRHDGTWLLEPSTSVFEMPPWGQEIFGDLYSYVVYCGENIFAKQYYRSDNRKMAFATLYNAETGESADIKDVLVYDAYDDYNTYCRTFFKNGKAFIVSDDMIYCIKKDFSLEPIVKNGPEKYVSFDYDVLFIGDKRESQNDESQPRVIDNVKLYNLDGEQILDLSQYTFVDNKILYIFRNGFIPALIYGEDGCYYAGWIGLDGEFAFDPVLVECELSDIGFYNNDRLISIRTEESVDGEMRGKYTLIMGNGDRNEFYTDQDVKSLNFNEGFSLIGHLDDPDGDGSGTTYYNGNFIDIHGNEIVPMLKTG